jgi:hypothetical protein
MIKFSIPGGKGRIPARSKENFSLRKCKKNLRFLRPQGFTVCQQSQSVMRF